MIILGYQGIGKSTLGGHNDVIDLESSNFWNNGKRPDDWYVYYCKVARYLSKQDYIVFVSSHKVVQDELKKCCDSVYTVFPSLALKKDWIEKLRVRYLFTESIKDYKAWKNAEEKYAENISELIMSGFQYYMIESMDYRLQDIVDYLVEFENEWHKK